MRYVVSFVRNEREGHHTQYIIQISRKGNGFKWCIQERYSTMLRLHQTLQLLGIDLPDFPKKRIFGNMNPEFILRRQQALEVYFQQICLIRAVAASPDFIGFVGEEKARKRTKERGKNVFEQDLSAFLDKKRKTDSIDIATALASIASFQN